MAFRNIKHANWNWNAFALVALLTLTTLACSVSDLFTTAFSNSQGGVLSLQGTWLWESDRTPAEKGVKAIFTQQGPDLTGHAVYPDGTDYLLLEGRVSKDGVVTLDTFWKGEFIPDPGASPCTQAATAQFFREYGDAKHPGYARGTMILHYDAETKELAGSKTYFHVVCEGNSVTNVEQPREDVILTRADPPPDQEESLLSVLGLCAGFVCVIVILLGTGVFIFTRSRGHRRT